MSRFASLNTLYNEYKNSAILNDIIVIGIGKDNDESIDQITSGNDLPWLKDNNSEFNQVWDNWGVANRDLIFLNNLSTSQGFSPINLLLSINAYLALAPSLTSPRPTIS